MKLFNKLLMVLAFVIAGSSAANAQSAGKSRKETRIAEIKDLVESQNYVFDANFVNPTRGAGRALTSDYDLTVLKDTVIAYLPYFGRAYSSPPYGSTYDGGIKFTNTHFTYINKPDKKGGWFITIKPTNKNISDWRDVQSLYLTISKDGYASLQVTSSNRDGISFNGTIEKRPVKKQ